MKKTLFVGALSVLAALAPVQAANATVIDFDDGVNGASVDGTYVGLGVFFSNATYGDFGALPGQSVPLVIYSSNGGTVFGIGDAIVGTFYETVGTVGIRALDIGAAGAQLNAYDHDGVLIGSSQFIGTGIGVGVFQDLSVTAAGIKSFKLFQVAPDGSDGLVFDNLSFDSAVPEASTWAMMIAGFALAGVSMRRRKTAISFA